MEWSKRPVLPPPGHQVSMNQRRASSEVDIDGAMSESESANENSRIAQSEEIVKQLEKSVPRWEGFGPGGWSTTIKLVYLPACRPGYHILTWGSRQMLSQSSRKYGVTRTQGTFWCASAKFSLLERTPVVERASAPSWTPYRM